MNLLKPLENLVEVYWNNRIDRHPETYRSFSKLVNHSVETSLTETIIIINDRCHPTPDNVFKIINLLNNGFAYVYLYNAGFFGLRKEVVRKMGWWDERHLNGDISDQELAIRLKEANLAFYEAQEVRYDQHWKSPLQNNEEYPDGIKHFEKKWSFENDKVVRLISEEFYNYNLNSIDKIDIPFKQWEDSILNINYLPNSNPSRFVYNKKVISLI
jgi:hypothetical protein